MEFIPMFFIGSARYYYPQLGRWWSVDPADESFSPYVYVGNKPIIAVDPDGKDTWFVHGTWVHSDTWGNEAKNLWQKILNDTKYNQHAFDWGGGNNGFDRYWGGVSLYMNIAAFNSDGPINIVAHSHGGNVAISAINLLVKENPEIIIDNLILIGTPDLDFNQLTPEALNSIQNFINIYNENDIWQQLGSFFSGDRKQTGAKNINVTEILESQGIDGPTESHTEMHNNPDIINKVGKQ